MIIPTGQTHKFGVLPLTPAYGRDYKSKKAVLEDLNANRDFMTTVGKPTNGPDLVAFGMTNGITIRYAKLTKVIVANFKDGVWK